MIVIDMDMPQNCTECPIFDHITGQCLVSAGDCPIKCDIEDIRAEIQVVMDMYEGCEYIGDKARRDELWHVLEIIDKHIKGDEK